MRFECNNPEHKYRIVWQTKQPIGKRGNKLLPACPGCRTNRHVRKFTNSCKPLPRIKK